MWSFTSDGSALAERAEPWLLRDPVRNTVPLTVLRSLRLGLFADDPLGGWVLGEDGEVAAAVVHTAPHPLLLSDFPIAYAAPLAASLIERDRAVTGVSGPLAVAEAFTDAWWQPEKSRRSERLFRLGALAVPSVPGRSRTASADDLELAVEWFRAFRDEADGESSVDPAPVVSARINREELLLWIDEGRPVSLAGVSAPLSGMSRVGPVYTPPEFRRRGYGSAVTAAASAKTLADGAAEVVLFTDLTNSTPNAIYQSIGYVPIAEHASIHFS